MNLSYIHLGLDYEQYNKADNDLRYEFQKHTNFIDDFFSKAIRKHRFKTDGSFNMISVAPTEFEISEAEVIPIDTLSVNLPFSRERYIQIKGTQDCGYYLELLEDGFKKASEEKKVPLDALLSIIEDFKRADCRNEWTHKKKRFREEDLAVVLNCEFTTNYFQLSISISQLSTGKELVNGAILKTETGVSIHQGMYKDIVLGEDIVITDSRDMPRVIIDKKKVFRNKLKFRILGDKEIKEMLSYKL